MSSPRSKLPEELLGALATGQPEVMKSAMKEGFDVASYSSGSDGLNAFHFCFFYGSLSESDEPLEYLQLLSASGVDINAYDNHGNTPLYYAIRSEMDPSIIQGLLDLGADPNLPCEKGDTPLRLALGRHPFQWDSAEVLLAAGADPDNRIDGKISIRELAEKFAKEEDRHRLQMFEG